MPRRKQTPAYRLHKPSGKAVVTIDGHDCYLGPYNSAASHAEYDRLIASWLAGGRQVLPKTAVGLTVAEVLDTYLRFAEGYYVKDGKVTSQVDRIERAIGVVTKLHPSTPATSFGPRALKAAREHMILRGWCRRYINQLVRCIQLAYTWAASEELIPETTERALRTITHLHAGRSAAPESEPIVPVEAWAVDATLVYCHPVLRSMIQVQRLSGMRPGEVCAMRRCDLSLSPAETMTLRGGLRVHAIEHEGTLVGLYCPPWHKTAHRNKSRIIALGPAALKELDPYLTRDPAAYLFSPAEADAQRFRLARAQRKTRVQPSQQNRRAPRRSRPPSDRYITDAYNRVIRETILKANRTRAKEDLPPIPHWFPLQLRHGVATKVNEEFDLWYGAAVLGHAKPDMTTVYAEQALKKAVEVMARAG